MKIAASAEPNESLREIRGSVHDYVGDLRGALDQLPTGDVAEFIAELTDPLLEGRRVFVAGNGGSATTASHMAADLSAAVDRHRGIGAGHIHCLSDSVARITAIANDFSYDDVFSLQLRSLAAEGDVLVLISISGTSRNVLLAAEAARKIGVRVLAMVGRESDLSRLSDRALAMGAGDYGIGEDLCLAVNHMAARVLRRTRAVTVAEAARPPAPPLPSPSAAR
ncbi:SIS domain-containing protein [Streptomonospora sp. S1-112]|uniref:SIS domain-containing protein n=1 Tax=Streptomonospora mangrovi TaxID=2883123 RepID=A0A9X3NKH8_9ACTN|nr:SIS domain-containing protein [Streptomonospora mangrovi]MDA0563793.1 SIS domain-containing protein [Streptomonospora mangrovi]